MNEWEKKCRLAQWLALLPHSDEVAGSIPGAVLCGVATRVLQLPPTVQKRACEVNWELQM